MKKIVFSVIGVMMLMAVMATVVIINKKPFTNKEIDFAGKDSKEERNSKAVLPAAESPGYTGKWIKKDGTAGPLTTEELCEQYAENAEEWQGTWVWE